jgi:hypothetical protein
LERGLPAKSPAQPIKGHQVNQRLRGTPRSNTEINDHSFNSILWKAGARGVIADTGKTHLFDVISICRCSDRRFARTIDT